MHHAVKTKPMKPRGAIHQVIAAVNMAKIAINGRPAGWMGTRTVFNIKRCFRKQLEFDADCPGFIAHIKKLPRSHTNDQISLIGCEPMYIPIAGAMWRDTLALLI